MTTEDVYQSNKNKVENFIKSLPKLYVVTLKGDYNYNSAKRNTYGDLSLDEMYDYVNIICKDYDVMTSYDIDGYNNTFIDIMSSDEDVLKTILRKLNIETNIKVKYDY